MAEQERREQPQSAETTESRDREMKDLVRPEVPPEEADAAKGGGMNYWEYWDNDNA